MEFFSVVIPLYNKALFVERTVHSVLAQTYRHFELIVVDDGSTDGGGDIVRSINDKRLRVVRQENLGASAARNRGIAEAENDLVALLDADDEWKPDFLETIWGLMEKNGEAGAYATAYEVCTPDNRVRVPNFGGEPLPGIIPNYFEMALKAELPPVCTSAVALRKHIFERVGYFAEGEELGEDIDMWGRVALFYPIAWSPKVCARYWRDDMKSACRVKRHKKNLPFIDTAMKANARGLVKEEHVPALMEYVARIQIGQAKEYVLAGNSKEARELLRQVKTTSMMLEKVYWLFWALMPKEFRLLCQRLKRIFS